MNQTKKNEEEEEEKDKRREEMELFECNETKTADG